jgi:hypothetical protein
LGRGHGHGSLWYRHSGIGLGLPLSPGESGHKGSFARSARVDGSLRITPALSSQRA